MKHSKHPAARPAVSALAPGAGPWSFRALFAGLLVVTLTAYYPALKGDFLWDDLGHVTSPALQAWSGLGRIWFEPGATQQYYPLLHSAFWFEHQIWGDATPGYHLINVLWHATSAGLLVVILRRLAVPGALLAGLVFALHPVGVESVAWISEQKNTLSTVFYLSAVLAWLRFEDERRPSRYVMASLWFVATLLTKTVTATLPGALLVLAWWQRGRLSWRNDVLPLLPWLVIGAVAGLGTAWFEHTQIGATGGEFALGAGERGLLAGRVVWFYFAKLLWPAGLAFFYPRWTIDAGVVWQWLFPAAALAALAAGMWWSRRDRGPLAAALLYGGTLVPVLGFVNVYPFVFSYVADHFQYLPSLGMIAFLAAATVRGFARLGWPRWSGPVAAAGVVLLLGTLTWRQSGMYRDVFSLYETTLARNPSSWVAHLNLGTALDDAGQPEGALPHLRRALELKPDYPEILNTLGSVLNHLGRPAEALPHLERAVLLQPRFAKAHNNLGASCMALGRAEEGRARFETAVRLEPDYVTARLNLGQALASAGRVPEATPHFTRAVQLDPTNGTARLQLGTALAMQARYAEALPHFEAALELDPESAEVHLRLAMTLRALGRLAEANEHYQAAIRLNASLAR